MKIRTWLYVLFLLLPALPGGAQDFSFRHLTTAEGLLSDLRLVMAEDRLGRLWVGSDEGINVFDGYQFTTYSIPDNSGLLNNNVRTIYCDSYGTIWIYTPHGIQYRKENDSRFRVLQTGDQALNASTPIMAETSDGRLVIVTGNNAWYISRDLTITKAAGLSALFKTFGSPICLQPFRGDEWLIGFQRKLLLVNLKNEQHLKTNNFSNTWYACRVNDSIALAGSFARDSIVLVNMNSGAVELINDWPTSDGQRMGGYAAGILSIGGGKYAIGSRYYGLYIADLNQRKFLHLTHDPATPSSLRTVFCRRIYITRDGTLFVHAKGLSYTPIYKPKFNTVKNLVNEKGELYDVGFTSFTVDKKGNYWLSTNSHLANWDRSTNISRFFPYFMPNGGPQKFKTVRAVVTDQLDRIWVGTFNGGLGMLKPDGSFEQYFRNPADLVNSIPSNEILDISKDTAGNFLLASNDGFGFFDPITKKATRSIQHPKLKKIATGLTNTVKADKKNNLWIGHHTGIYYYDRQLDSLYTIPLPPEIKDRTINSICLDSTGNVYAGAWSGLYVIPNGKFTISRHITKADGILSNNVMNLVCDPHNKIWIIGNVGLARYDPARDKLQTFDARDGLEHSNHPLSSGYISPSGEMFVASSDGFNYFFPAEIDTLLNPLQVFVTSLELKDSIISLPQLNNRSFRYFQNNFSFTYQSVDFNRAPVIQYRYRLHGFDTAWVIAGKQRTARYTNLSPGQYRFVVEASANGKDWYSIEQDLSYRIRKAIWDRWWFRLLIGLLIATVVYLFYRSRLRQINKEARVRSDYEIKLNELENSALRTQMNPHFIFNSLNTINSFINSNDRIQANQYISKFSKLVRLILDHSREKKILLQDELEVAELYMQLEQIRFERRFNYEIDVKDIDPSLTEVPPLIIQPFVENAILHGLLPRESDGLLKLSIRKNGPLLLCTVEDNGIGREAARKLKESSGFRRKSHGMEITLKRIELFNRELGVQESVRIIDLVDVQGGSGGTRVEIPLAYLDSF